MSTFARASFPVNPIPRPVAVPSEFLAGPRYSVHIVKNGAEVRDRNRIVATYYGAAGETVAKKAAYRLNRADEQEDGERWDGLA